MSHHLCVLKATLNLCTYVTARGSMTVIQFTWIHATGVCLSTQYIHVRYSKVYEASQKCAGS